MPRSAAGRLQPCRPAAVPPPHARCAVIIAWVAGLMTPFFLILHKLGLMRVSADVEALGLDIRCGGPGSACAPRAGRARQRKLARRD